MLTSANVQRALPWIAGGILILGAITFLQVQNSPDETEASRPTRSIPLPPEPKTVPPSPEARRAVARFIRTAVARRNLAEAWTITGPALRQGLTRKQWLTGAIPVVPFDLDPSAKPPVKLEWSYPNAASFQVVLEPRRGSTDELQTFYVTVRKFGAGRAARWLVNYWAPTPAPGPRETFTE